MDSVNDLVELIHPYLFAEVSPRTSKNEIYGENDIDFV